MSILNPRVAIFITLQLDVLRDERPTCDWNGLVPRFVVYLSEGVCMADELTSGPSCKLTVVPRKIAPLVILFWVLQSSEVKYGPRSDEVAAEFGSFLLIDVETG